MLKKKLRKILLYALAIFTSAVVVFPIYWLFNTSLQPNENIFNTPPVFFPAINPIIAYAEYLAGSDFILWIRNTFFVSSIATLISTAAALPAGFALSKFKFRGHTMAVFTVLLTQMLPGVLLIIPIYIIFVNFRLINSLLGLIVIYTALTIPIGLWFLKGFFDSIPDELMESARLDGCHTMDILIRIMVPLVKPGIIATATWSFIIAWDDYLYVSTMITSHQLWTLAVGLAGYIGQFDTPWNLIMTGAVLTTLPVGFLFMFFQRYLVGGLVSGAVKG